MYIITTNMGCVLADEAQMIKIITVLEGAEIPFEYTAAYNTLTSAKES